MAFDADSQHTTLSASDLLDDLLDMFKLAQRTLGRRQQCFAGRRETQTPPFFGPNLGPDTALELADGMAQRRLRQTERIAANGVMVAAADSLRKSLSTSVQ